MALKDLGNSTGYVYVTDTGGTKIYLVMRNTKDGARRLRQHAVTSSVNAIRTNGSSYADLSKDYDAALGFRYWINADYSGTASPSSLTNAVEITSGIVVRGGDSNIPVISASIFSDVVSPARKSNVQVLIVDTEGSASADALVSITEGDFVHGDILIVRGADAARVVTVTDNDNTTSSAKNIYLSSNNNFATGDDISSITLQAWKPTSGSTFKWVELSRNTGAVIDYGYVNQRSDGVPTPKPGVEQYTLLASQATQEREAGVDEGIINITGSSVTLTSGFTLKEAASPSAPPVDGDYFIVNFLATGVSLNGQPMTIFGKTISQSLLDSGEFAVYAYYNSTSSSWTAIIHVSNPSGVSGPIITGSGANSAKQNGGANKATGANSFAANSNNESKGADTSTFGNGNTVEGARSAAFGQNNVVPAGADDTVVFGDGITANSSAKTSGGVGRGHSLNDEKVFATGQDGVARMPGHNVHGDLKFGTSLFTQSGKVPMQASVTDATATHMLIQGTSTQQLKLDVNSVMKFVIDVTAVQHSGSAGTAGDFAAWKCYVTAKNIGGTVTLLDKTWLTTDKLTKEHSGTATAGTSTTITLASGADATDSYYVGDYIYITGGTGAGQYRRVSAYVGSTKVATLESGWTTTPDATSTYRIVKKQAYDAAAVAWDLDIQASATSHLVDIKFTGETNKSIYVGGTVTIEHEVKYAI